MLRVLIAVSLLVSPALHAGCLVPAFQPAKLTDRAALSLVTVDLNDDGRPEIAGITTTGAFILHNDGKGNFSTPVDVYSGALSGTIVAGDFNGDGRADLLFMRDGAVVVLPGNDDGTFATAIESHLSMHPDFLAVARFASRNALDVAAVDRDAAQLAILRNDGSGRFTLTQPTTVQPKPHAMAAGDLDGDGNADVVISYDSGSNLDVFYGQAGGAHDPAVTVAAIAGVSGIAVADMDGDGKPDLAVCSFQSPVAVIRNLGGRAFGDPLTYSTVAITSLTGTVIADLTGDGVPDLASLGACGIRTSTGFGKGTLAQQGWIDVTLCVDYGGSGSIVAADLDGDGRIDLVTAAAGAFANHGVVAFRNACGDGVLTATLQTPVISVGQSTAVIVSMQPLPPQNYFATGTITIHEGQRVLAAVSLNTIGGQPIGVSNLAAGDHALTVDYSGDRQFSPAQSAPLIVHVTTDTTTTTLTSDQPRVFFGSHPIVTATVTSSTGDVPTGPVRFTIDRIVQSGLNGAVTAPAAKLAAIDSVGTHTITADYLGDATYPPSSAVPLTYVVRKAIPVMETFKTFGMANESGKGFNVLADTAGGEAYPKGDITMRIDDTLVGTQSTKDQPYASFVLPPLAAGLHFFRFAFSGDANFEAAESEVPYIVFPATPAIIDARATLKGVVATWNTDSHVALSRKKPDDAAWSTAMCCSPPPFTDPNAAPNSVYLYRSDSYDHTNVSNVDVAVTYNFTDDPLPPGVSVTTAVVADVIEALNMLRAAAHLAPFSLPAFARPTHGRATGAVGVPISELQPLRDSINEARQKLGAYPFAFARAATGSTIDALQLQELREAIR